MVTVWYALHGHAPQDVTGHRTRARWYTTKTEPSYDDMAVKLRRVIIAARFRGPCPEQATPQETRAVLAAWVAAGTSSTPAKHEGRGEVAMSAAGERCASGCQWHEDAHLSQRRAPHP